MHEQKAFSVVPKASPSRPNHVTICLLRHSGESLQNGQLEFRRLNWYFTRETHKDTAVSIWACQAGFWKRTRTLCQLRSKPHAVFHGVCKIALTEVLATQMGVMRRSKKVSSFELLHCINLIHFCLTVGWLRWSSCIVIPGVVCELLQFAATQWAGIVNVFVDHTHTQFTEESKMATTLTPQSDVTFGKVTCLMENPRL